MSRGNTVWGFLQSDSPMVDKSQIAVHEIQARLVVEHGATVIVTLSEHGAIDITVESTKQPSVTLSSLSLTYAEKEDGPQVLILRGKERGSGERALPGNDQRHQPEPSR